MAAATARDDAQAGLGETDYGVGGENAEVRRESEFEAAAESDGGDGADGGDGEGGDGVEGAADASEKIGGSG